MQATQNFSTKNRNGHAVSKNSALPDPEKVNSPTNSKYDKLKLAKSLKGEHQRSGSQNMSFPESDHQKNQVAPHKKNVAKICSRICKK